METVISEQVDFVSRDTFCFLFLLAPSSRIIWEQPQCKCLAYSMDCSLLLLTGLLKAVPEEEGYVQ